MRFSVCFLLCALSCACAGIDFESVADNAADKHVDGIRYYETKPFLLVYSDGKGGVTSEVHFLPDLSQKRSLDPYAVMASNEVTLTFAGGVLTQGLSAVDETIVPKAVLEAVATVGSSAMKFLLNEPGTRLETFPAPALFEIVPDGDTILLSPVPVVSKAAFETNPPDDKKVAGPIRLKAGQ